MQSRMTTTADSPSLLVERVRSNRLVLEEAALRLSAARALAQERRDETLRLLRQAREGLSELRQRRAGARDRQEAMRAPVPVLPRYSPTPADPLDSVRQKLHEAYAATGDSALRAELLASYDGFARSLALKYRHRESVDDLMQVARIGLLHAIDRFDPALGRPFPLFARITITGELKRHIRDRTWSMRVPRSLQEDYLNVMRAVTSSPPSGPTRRRWRRWPPGAGCRSNGWWRRWSSG